MLSGIQVSGGGLERLLVPNQMFTKRSGTIPFRPIFPYAVVRLLRGFDLRILGVQEGLDILLFEVDTFSAEARLEALVRPRGPCNNDFRFMYTLTLSAAGPGPVHSCNRDGVRKAWTA